LAERIVTVRASRREVREILRKLPAASVGLAGTYSLANALLVRIGQAALGRIRRAFIDKAHGGADETGLSWQKLDPRTIAYKRRHLLVGRSGQMSKKRRLPSPGTRAGYRPSFQLTEPERKRWWGYYRKFLSVYRGDKAHAAATAWTILKAQGAKTLLMVYGGAQVDILRDTGLLLNSLSPGIINPGSSSPPHTLHQVFRLLRGEVIIGTNREGAAYHHRGVPGRLPRRPLWPGPSTWTSAWWQDILEQARQGVIEIALHLLGVH
jgi:hypothetical protein